MFGWIGTDMGLRKLTIKEKHPKSRNCLYQIIGGRLSWLQFFQKSSAIAKNSQKHRLPVFLSFSLSHYFSLYLCCVSSEHNRSWISTISWNLTALYKLCRFVIFKPCSDTISFRTRQLRYALFSVLLTLNPSFE